MECASTQNKHNVTGLIMQLTIEKTQVNLPFRMFMEGKYDEFIKKYRINPEIGLDAVALDQYTGEDYKTAFHFFSDLGSRITIHGPFMDLSAGSQDPAIRDITKKRFAQLTEAAKILKPVHIVCHPGYESRRYSQFRESWVEKSLEIWAWLAEKLGETECRLMLENVYEDGPEDIKVLFERLEKFNVGFCLDTGHHFAFGKESLETWIKELGKYIGHIHLHDNCGDSDGHMPPGQGRIDFSHLLKYLDERRNCLPIITFEPHEEKDYWPSLEYLKEFFHKQEIKI